MKPAAFEYHRPGTLAAALQCLRDLDDARPLAGGQSLMAMMNFRYLTPAHVIDLNRIDELAGIRESGGRIRIGAMTRQRDMLDSSLLAARCPLVIEALTHVGHVQTRNRGTLGGSLSHLDPAAELPGVMAALDAELEVHGPQGARRVPMAEWPLAYMTPALDAGELLVAVHVTPWGAHHGFGFRELARRHGDFAIAGAAVMIEVNEDAISRAAIALIGVDDGPLRLHDAESSLIGQPPTAELLGAAAAFALHVPGIEDVHASPAYRRKVARVMVRRALDDALRRATDAAGRHG